MNDSARPDASRPLEDTLYRGERTIVSRRWDEATGDYVVHKALFGKEALARLRHEARIYQRLDGVGGVPRVRSEGPGAVLTLSDNGGAVLTGCTPFPPLTLIMFAARIARILCAVHRRGVLHLDICPANLLIDADGRPELVNFHRATSSAETRREFTQHNEIVGTLSYLAPEQTGRMDRAVDQRTDLYGFGATLYELATGAPPFGDDDPLRLVRDHLVTVPVSPAALAPSLPRAFADIILRLLEKEPDCRYQSAEGVADDLDRLHAMLVRGDNEPFVLAIRDFPPRLAAPSRPVGREVEIAILREAFANALTGRCRCVLIAGPPGVGKTALIDQLRPVVGAQGGWFVAGWFDQFHQDGVPAGFLQAMRSVVTLLLAEPDDALNALRARLIRTLGADADPLRAALPEARKLLGDSTSVAGGGPEGGPDIERRTGRACILFLRQVVSPARPLVIAVNGLQWAPMSSLRFFGTLLTADPLPGLLIVAAYRDGELDSPHPLAASLHQWELAGVLPLRLRLENLPPAALSLLLAEILRLPADAADALAEAIGPRTGGNPIETVELLNALRRDGALVLGGAGWQWDAAAIRRHVGKDGVLDLLGARITALPLPAQQTLSDISCLGAVPTRAALTAATGMTIDTLEERLAPVLEDGVLTLEHGMPGTEAVLRWGHERVKQRVYTNIDADARKARHLALARGLASHAEFATQAAEQYLLGVEAIEAPEERLRAAALFDSSADHARRIFHYASAERYLAAAIGLREAVPGKDVAMLTRSRIAHLTMLYNLGRHEDADRVFASVEQPETNLLILVEASCAQVSSLSSRGKHRQALAVGLAMLARLNVWLPTHILLRPAQVDHRLAEMLAWVQADVAAGAAARIEIEEPMLQAVAKLLNRMLPPAGFTDPFVAVWLLLESQRLWATFGVCPALVANLGRVAIATHHVAGKYRINYEVARHAMTVGQSRCYEPETSHARQSWAVFGLHWFEPLEKTPGQAEAARAGLLHYGEFKAVYLTYLGSLAALFDTAPTLEFFAAEIDSACVFATRTGNDDADAAFHAHLHLLQALTGVADASPRPRKTASPSARETVMARFDYHFSHVLIAIFFDDPAALDRHTAAVMPLLDDTGGPYQIALAYLLRALSLADAARKTQDKPTVLPDEFETCRAWLAARAIDAPCNFAQMLHLAEAEQAWTRGEFAVAVAAFDQALQCCSTWKRPWHHALIAERAGQFYLSHGIDYAGRALLVEARNRYADWGATAVVRRLTAAHDFLAAGSQTSSISITATDGGISSDGIDLLAILRASQALSSQTTIDGLRDRIAELLGDMAGATSVGIVLWCDETERWVLPSDADDGAVPVEEAAANGRLPLSAFRYALRMEAPLVVDDAVQHDHFAQDPYFAAMQRCSLLVLPVRSQGKTRAVLVLENRLSRGVFSHARLDAVKLVAGQLAVSLDNAQLYASLERRVADRTEALALAIRRLEALSISDAVTGLANRRCFDDVLKREWSRATRTRDSIAAVMIDIDFFKRYNDHYGHIAGDRCLRTVAAVLHASVRQDVDLVARYGGEEFVFILPGTDLATAASVAERVCATVAALQEPHAGSELGHLTVSVGVAASAANEEARADELIEQADAALYRAKRQGRNRVELAGATPPNARNSAAA